MNYKKISHDCCSVQSSSRGFLLEYSLYEITLFCQFLLDDKT